MRPTRASPTTGPRHSTTQAHCGSSTSHRTRAGRWWRTRAFRSEAAGHLTRRAAVAVVNPDDARDRSCIHTGRRAVHRPAWRTSGPARGPGYLRPCLRRGRRRPCPVCPPRWADHPGRRRSSRRSCPTRRDPQPSAPWPAERGQQDQAAGALLGAAPGPVLPAALATLDLVAGTVRARVRRRAHAAADRAENSSPPPARRCRTQGRHAADAVLESIGASGFIVVAAVMDLAPDGEDGSASAKA